MSTPPQAVVVAVSEDGYDAAVAFAVDQARRTGNPIHLVHVLLMPTEAAYAGLDGGLRESAASLLAHAHTATEEAAGPGIAVTSELVDDGWVVRDLVRRSENASLVVLQHRNLSRVRRVFTGSVSQGVAGRSHAPVVAVPEDWRAGATPRRVVVAAQEPIEALPLVVAGLEEARSRGSAVQVVHACWLTWGYDEAVVDSSYRDHWISRARTELEAVLTPARGAYPDVETTISISSGPPVEAVLVAARDADLVVLGRRHHRMPLGSHLGPVARAVLAHAPCPVMVAPELKVTADSDGVAREAAPEGVGATS